MSDANQETATSADQSTDDTAQLPEICSLCGSSEVQVRTQLKEDDEVAHRALCEVHAAKLERFWKQEQERRRVRTVDTGNDQNKSMEGSR